MCVLLVCDCELEWSVSCLLGFGDDLAICFAFFSGVVDDDEFVYF